jgi:hypothetical protein
LSKHLHIITLNIPFPPDYGGIIDTYYRIEALNQQGVLIHLHCFEYGRARPKELESICETVNYYPRKSGLKSHLSVIPQIVSSRKAETLLDNLTRDNYPILFDGLHTTYYLNHPALANRKKLVRSHNIEHQYYRDLAKAESRLFKKIFFYLESIKLKRYEKVFGKADFILTVSESDQSHFKEKYHNSYLISSFHPFKESVSLTGFGEYAIFHGDLSVKENELIAESLIRNVFSKISYSLIITGKNPSNRIQRVAANHSNIKILANPVSSEMLELIRNAHIQVLPAESSNGLKLKLLFGLFAGRHCLINSKMAKCIQPKELCHIADSGEEIMKKIHALMKMDFTMEMLQERQKLLDQFYSNYRRSQQLVNLIFSE